MLESMNLFNGIDEKMNYLAQRQKVLSQNVTNSDTPGYRPNDLRTPDFAHILGASSKDPKELGLVGTQPGHVTGLTPLTAGNKNLTAERKTYEVSPVGNAVDLEEQMMKSSKTNMDYQLMTNLYSKNLGLLRSAMRSNH